MRVMEKQKSRSGKKTWIERSRRVGVGRLGLREAEESEWKDLDRGVEQKLVGKEKSHKTPTFSLIFTPLSSYSFFLLLSSFLLFSWKGRTMKSLSLEFLEERERERELRRKERKMR